MVPSRNFKVTTIDREPAERVLELVDLAKVKEKIDYDNVVQVF